MTLRVALPESERRLEAVTVARACEILGCDATTVRALLREGAIEGHRIGKSEKNPNGVRVELQSILDYKARHAISAEAAPDRPKRREASQSYREAVAESKRLGLRF